jgi:hypothetical protein
VKGVAQADSPILAFAFFKPKKIKILRTFNSICVARSLKLNFAYFMFEFSSATFLYCAFAKLEGLRK